MRAERGRMSQEAGGKMASISSAVELDEMDCPRGTCESIIDFKTLLKATRRDVQGGVLQDTVK